MAEAFIENPNNYKQVNHIDGNKLNNNLDNLEWTTNSANTKHGYDNGLYASRHRCSVIATNKNTGERLVFSSIRECSDKLKLNRKIITAILKQTKKTNNYDYDFAYNV